MDMNPDVVAALVTVIAFSAGYIIAPGEDEVIEE